MDFDPKNIHLNDAIKKREMKSVILLQPTEHPESPRRGWSVLKYKDQAGSLSISEIFEASVI